jgi:hypothetical protein
MKFNHSNQPVSKRFEEKGKVRGLTSYFTQNELTEHHQPPYHLGAHPPSTTEYPRGEPPSPLSVCLLPLLCPRHAPPASPPVRAAPSLQALVNTGLFLFFPLFFVEVMNAEQESPHSPVPRTNCPLVLHLWAMAALSSHLLRRLLHRIGQRCPC